MKRNFTIGVIVLLISLSLGFHNSKRVKSFHCSKYTLIKIEYDSLDFTKIKIYFNNRNKPIFLEYFTNDIIHKYEINNYLNDTILSRTTIAYPTTKYIEEEFEYLFPEWKAKDGVLPYFVTIKIVNKDDSIYHIRDKGKIGVDTMSVHRNFYKFKPDMPTFELQNNSLIKKTINPNGINRVIEILDSKDSSIQLRQIEDYYLSGIKRTITKYKVVEHYLYDYSKKLRRIYKFSNDSLVVSIRSFEYLNNTDTTIEVMTFDETRDTNINVQTSKYFIDGKLVKLDSIKLIPSVYYPNGKVVHQTDTVRTINYFDSNGNAVKSIFKDEFGQLTTSYYIDKVYETSKTIQFPELYNEYFEKEED